MDNQCSVLDFFPTASETTENEIKSNSISSPPSRARRYFFGFTYFAAARSKTVGLRHIHRGYG